MPFRSVDIDKFLRSSQYSVYTSIVVSSWQSFTPIHSFIRSTMKHYCRLHFGVHNSVQIPRTSRHDQSWTIKFCGRATMEEQWCSKGASQSFDVRSSAKLAGNDVTCRHMEDLLCTTASFFRFSLQEVSSTTSSNAEATPYERWKGCWWTCCTVTWPNQFPKAFTQSSRRATMAWFRCRAAFEIWCCRQEPRDHDSPAALWH